MGLECIAVRETFVSRPDSEDGKQGKDNPKKAPPITPKPEQQGKIEEGLRDDKKGKKILTE
jgi:hypothetical protein